MAGRKDQRKLKKRQEQMERAEKKEVGRRKKTELAKSKTLAKLEKTALKADKIQRGKEKELREKKARERLEKTRTAAEDSAHALKEEEAALKKKEGILQKDLEDQQPSTEGVVDRLWKGISKTRENLTGGLGRVIFGKKKIDRDLFGDIEELLISADIGVETTQRLMEAVQNKVRRNQLNDPQKIGELLKTEINRVMNRTYSEVNLDNKKPAVIFFVGVNGTGKTTTIGKIAAKYREEGKKVLLAAGDTFRAAAAEQLAGWSDRAGCDIFSKEPGADPSAVIHEALRKGIDEGYDIVLCDTAGRLHTKTNLMEELKKIKRVVAKQLPEAPHEIYLVLDGNTGQNAIFQTRDFHREIGVTGLIITKLDGTAKGGVVIGIVNEFDIPIRYIGIGEGVDDLRAFDPLEFAASIID